jgi:hypothetical protein
LYSKIYYSYEILSSKKNTKFEKTRRSVVTPRLSYGSYFAPACTTAATRNTGELFSTEATTKPFDNFVT